MQVRFIMILHVQGYNSLSCPTLQCKVWSTIVSKYKLGQLDHLIISIFLTNLVTFLIPYFTGSNMCHKSCLARFCLQSTVTECLILFISGQGEAVYLIDHVASTIQPCMI